MTRRSQQIGFSQRIQLDWLEFTANLLLAGNTRSEVESALQELLRDKVSVGGTAERGNREKIITILLKIWQTPPTDLESLRNSGLELLKRTPLREHVGIHWGMVMSVYPFWAGVAHQVGRLLRLQGTAVAAHIQRRVREQYGERETVSRAARRVLRSFSDWGVLAETDAPGVYGLSEPILVHDSEVVSWMLEAALHSTKTKSAPFSEILDSPALFPFRLTKIRSDCVSDYSGNLEIIRHGLDDELVILKSPSPKLKLGKGPIRNRDTR